MQRWRQLDSILISVLDPADSHEERAWVTRGYRACEGPTLRVRQYRPRRSGRAGEMPGRCLQRRQRPKPAGRRRMPERRTVMTEQTRLIRGVCLEAEPLAELLDRLEVQRNHESKPEQRRRFPYREKYASTCGFDVITEAAKTIEQMLIDGHIVPDVAHKVENLVSLCIQARACHTRGQGDGREGTTTAGDPPLTCSPAPRAGRATCKHETQG